MKKCKQCGQDAPFQIGDKVRVIEAGVDFYFFHDKPTGIIISISGEYLGIKVLFDKPRNYGEGHVQKDFGFNPEHLERVKPTP